LTPYIMKLAYPTLAFLENHMSEQTRKLLDSYTERRRAGSTTKKRAWAAPASRLIRMLLLQVAMAPGINKFLRLFNENLYARERLAESKRGLEREVEDMLISLDMNIAEVEVPANSAFAGKALKDLSIRGKTGASIVRIIRGGININIPGGNHKLYPGDRIILAGSDADIATFRKLLDISMTDTSKMDKNTHIVIDNFPITADSPICEKSIISSGIREKGGCIVISILKANEEVFMNPDPNIVLHEGDVVFVAGEQEKMQEFFNS
ncbi:MAG: TrkA C-terminal domain-containing protein, partial [Bacteroidaceae bacterium]|nr:TrkA C-terminal domain-containing protein [Bacteroidaceae bacterium]